MWPRVPMKLRVLVLLALAAQHVAASQAPVQKVLGLLKEMKVKGAAAMETEKAQHAEFSAFCQKTLSDKQQAIEEGGDRIERLEADIEKFQASVTTLTSDIQTHTKEIATAEQDAEKTSAARDQEVADYDSTLKEYEDSIGAIAKALELLNAQKGEDASALLSQLSSPSRLGRELQAFLQKPKAYDFQSNVVVDMLDKLSAKFVEEKAALEKAETEKKTSHQLVMTSLKNQKTAASEAKEEKTEFKSKAEQNLANAKADLEESKSTLEEDTKYQKDLKVECKSKAMEFETNQRLRAEELDAIAKASEIIAGSTVSGAAKHLESGFLQRSSLAMLRATPRGTAAAVSSALQVLRAGAASEAQRALIQRLEMMEQVDSEMKRNETLQGVKDVLQKYLTNLESERANEIEHEAFCTRELASNNRTKKQKTAKVESLTAEIDQLESSIAKLSEDIADISSQITKLSSALSEATKLRGDEKAKNSKTIAESQAAQEAVTEAINLLQEAFEKTAAISLLQIGSKTGVVTLLETVLGDFSRLEAETKAQELAADKEFKAFKTDSNMDKASKQSDAQHFTEEKTEASKALAQKKVDLASSKTELTSAEQYFKELSQQCLSSDSDAAKQKAHREEEIQNLKTALKELEE